MSIITTGDTVAGAILDFLTYARCYYGDTRPELDPQHLNRYALQVAVESWARLRGLNLQNRDPDWQKTVQGSEAPCELVGMPALGLTDPPLVVNVTINGNVVIGRE